MFGKKTSKARLELEKERLELRLKKQEFEIKKTLLDVKAKYHPMSIMATAASDFMNRSVDEEESRLEAFSASVSNAFKERKQEQNSPVDMIKSFAYNTFVLLASFFDSLSFQLQDKQEQEFVTEKEPLPKKEQAEMPTPENPPPPPSTNQNKENNPDLEDDTNSSNNL